MPEDMDGNPVPRNGAAARKRFFAAPAGDEGFAVDAFGIEENMSAGVVDRPGGTGNRLLMFFPAGATVRTARGERTLAGECSMLWDDGAAHWYGTPGRPWCHSWVHFRGGECDGLIAAAGAVPGELRPADYQAAVRHLRYLADEAEDPRPAQGAALRGAFLNLLRETGRSRPAPAVAPGLRRALALLERDGPPPPLAELAAAACMSRSRFAAAFTAAFGVSPLAFARRRRLREAAYLLRDRNLQVQEIAARLGFSDPLYFSRAFRREFGVPPRVFRAPGAAPAAPGAGG